MKLRLTVILSGQAFQEIELERFTRVLVGRADDCQVQLDNAAVSRHHFEILREGDLLRINDMGGQNGTVLNGVKIERHGLKHGDVITIGKLTIDVEVVGQRTQSRRSDRAVSGKMTLAGDPEALAQAQRQGEARVRGYLSFPGAKPTDPDRHVPLEQPRYVFGKTEGADVALRGWFAPRLAAVILREDFGFRIIDLSPRGGSLRVNGAPAMDVRLAHDDQLEVRRIRFRFRQGKPA